MALTQKDFKVKCPMINTALIIPCYNEENRLPREEFLKAANQYFLILVNDGSKDGTLNYLRELKHTNIAIVNLEKNVGKANAVRAGVLSLKKDSRFKDIEWFGFLDADLSTPFREIPNFFIYQKTFYPESKGIWGSRIYKLGSNIKRHAKRHYTGRIFATFAHIICKIETYDSQCGAKLFHTSVLETAFSEPFISRWLFDIEIYLRLADIMIIEYPLQEWKDVQGSKVSLVEMFFKTIPELIKIRNYYGVE
jgi:glycosyltransferase involved in cell wall biosynthesis